MLRNHVRKDLRQMVKYTMVDSFSIPLYNIHNLFHKQWSNLGVLKEIGIVVSTIYLLIIA